MEVGLIIAPLAVVEMARVEFMPGGCWYCTTTGLLHVSCAPSVGLVIKTVKLDGIGLVLPVLRERYNDRLTYRNTSSMNRDAQRASRSPGRRRESNLKHLEAISEKIHSLL